MPEVDWTRRKSCLCLLSFCGSSSSTAGVGIEQRRGITVPKATPRNLKKYVEEDVDSLTNVPQGKQRFGLQAGNVDKTPSCVRET